MNAFEQKLKEAEEYPLRAKNVNTIQVNMGYRCNLRCTHCHVEASPDRDVIMELKSLYKIINVLIRNDEIMTVIMTGGAPEMNPHFGFFVRMAAVTGRQLVVCSNLAVYTEPGMEDIPGLLAEYGVKIVASVPSYNREDFDRQRGKGTYDKVIHVFKRLNELGYGSDEGGRNIDIIFNPVNSAVAPNRSRLECMFRKELYDMHGIQFNRLITFNNVPVGRLKKAMTDLQAEELIEQLEVSFKPGNIESLMCRYQINVSPDERLFDCGFKQSLDQPIDGGRTTLDTLNIHKMRNREIRTSPYCFVCTASTGTTCRSCVK